ncbi:MAG: lytic polysaccharide monooxygenase, partial [Glaciimonas sp.]|nr:lytic polysaccharide monooxygenase [Glaciimonas sp.]
MHTVAGALLAVAAAPSFSHGTLIDPISREYFCKTVDNPENPQTAGCKAAQLINGSQQFYDWQANVQGGHHDGEAGHKIVVPDGKICAGGKESMRGLDAIAEWVATPVTPNAEGKVKLTYLQTAGHVTNYFKTYITNNNYDFSRPITWSDLINRVLIGPDI